MVAAGAIERPIVFRGNDRPGVMMASAVRTYVNRFAALPGRQVAVFTNNDDGWRTVETVQRAGAEVVAVVDSRGTVPDRHRAAAARVPVIHGVVTKAEGGADGLRRIEVTASDGSRRMLAADCLAVSGGWNPDLALSSFHRGRPAWRDDIAAFVPGKRPPGMSVAGAANGALSLAACLREGHEPAARQPPIAAPRRRRRRSANGRGERRRLSITPLWHVKAAGKAFVDLQNDVTAADVQLAEREGFDSVEHLKRYTTLGMATDQGKTSNVNGLAIMAEARGRTIPETGTTIFRPPHVPVAIGAFAGHNRDEHFHAVRLPPSHHWAAAPRRRVRGGRPVDAGPVVSASPARRTGCERSAARCAPCAAASASATSPRSARSTCRDRTPGPSSTASTSTPSRPSPSARRATA